MKYKNGLRDTDLQGGKDDGQDHQRRKQRASVQRFAIEDRDDDNGADIVGNGQRQEKYFEVRRYPFDHAQYAQREGDVRRHGHAPAMLTRLMIVQGDEQ